MRLNFFKTYFFFVLLLCGFADAAGDRLSPAAPALLPHTERAMKTAGFWIGRHPFPDKVILAPDEIERFNAKVRDELSLTKDLLKLPAEFSGDELRRTFTQTLKEFQEKKYYLGAMKAGKDFFQEMKANMNLDAVPEKIRPRFGFIARFADQRFFPTDEGLYEKPNDRDFDELQDSDLDAGTPVIVLHTSQDGKWFYVLSELLDGWVKAEKVGLCPSEQEFKDYFSKERFGVVIAAKADIFWDANLSEYYDYVRMGVKFPVSRIMDNGIVEVVVPARSVDGTVRFKRGYMKKEDMHEGYLSYTPRHIMEQAFKLLNEPYGWGGMHGEQDCSRFLQEVFATVGINFPRNSSQQAQIGRPLAQFDTKMSEAERLKVLREAVGGITILPMPGHIMLFLGMVDERPYAIHATWGYREKIGREESSRVINRVAVSDLSLGEGTLKGSLLRRLKSVVLIAL